MSKNNELINTSSDASTGDRPGITRRRFLYYTGIGVGSMMLANPLSAFAAETGKGTDSKTSSDSWDNVDPEEEIKDTFKFGSNNSSSFVYSGEFFDGSSFEYQNDLAAFACCLALASYGVNDKSSEYEKSGDNVEAFLDQINCEDIILNDDFTQPTQHNSIGLACGHRHIMIGDDKFELVLMGIRGSNYFLEWCGNVSIGKEGDHNGFRAAGETAYAFLKDYVSNHVPTDRPLKILISGFSRASAVSNMVGGLMVREASDNGLMSAGSKGFYFGGKDFSQNSSYPFPKHSVSQSNVYIYGFEVPANMIDSGTGNTGMTIDPLGNIHSIVNPCDPVPKIVPNQWGFKRFGADFTLPRPSETTYSAARNDMKAHLANMETNAVYPVDSFDHMDMSMDVFFDTLIDKLSRDLIGSRDNYYNTWQETAVFLMDYVESGKLATVKQGASMTAFKAFLIEDVIMTVASGLLSPATGLFEIIYAVFEIFTDHIFNDLLDSACNKLRAAGLAWGQDEENLYNKLSALCPKLSKFARSNVSLTVAMVKTFLVDAHTLDVHSGAVCLAWMQSNDTANYLLPVKDDDDYDPNTDTEGDTHNNDDTSGVDGSDINTNANSTASAAALTAAAGVASERIVAKSSVADEDEGDAGDDSSNDAGTGDNDGKNDDANSDETAKQEKAAGKSKASGSSDSDKKDEGVSDDADSNSNNGTTGKANDNAGKTADDGSDTNDSGSNDGDAAADTGDSSIYRKVLFDGNIDVELAGPDKYVTLFKNGQRVENSEIPYAYGLNEDYQMFVIVGAKTNYMFRVNSALDDTFHVTVIRYENGDAIPTKVIGYKAIGADNETLYINLKTDRMFIAASEDGDIAYDWTFKVENEDKDQDTHYFVDLKSADEAMGQVFGGGYNVRGSSSMLVALPNAGYEFDYWTVDGKGIRNPAGQTVAESETSDGRRAVSYLFYVDKDSTVIANFKKKASDSGSDDADGSASDGEAAENEGASPAKTMPETGDSTGFAAAAAGIAAAGAAVAAGFAQTASNANGE